MGFSIKVTIVLALTIFLVSQKWKPEDAWVDNGPSSGGKLAKAPRDNLSPLFIRMWPMIKPTTLHLLVLLATPVMGMQPTAPVIGLPTPVLSSLCITAINVESILSAIKQFEFSNWVKTQNPDVIMFSEHHFKKQQEPKRLLEGYNCYFNSLSIANKWGVGIAIRDRIPAININIPTGPLLGRAIAVDIIVSENPD